MWLLRWPGDVLRWDGKPELRMLKPPKPYGSGRKSKVDATSSERQFELRLLHTQTIIAGLSTVSTLALSIVGIWLGIQVNRSEQAQHDRDVRREKTERAVAERKADEAQCLAVHLQFIEASSAAEGSDSAKPALQDAARRVVERCHKVGVTIVLPGGTEVLNPLVEFGPFDPKALQKGYGVYDVLDRKTHDAYLQSWRNRLKSQNKAP